MSVGNSDIRSALPVLALILVSLTAGCAALPSSGPTPADVEQEIIAADPPDEVSATVDVRRTIDGETTQYTEDVWLHADGRSRVETSADGTETVVVDDGDGRWHYDVASESGRLASRPTRTRRPTSRGFTHSKNGTSRPTRSRASRRRRSTAGTPTASRSIRRPTRRSSARSASLSRTPSTSCRWRPARETRSARR